MGDSDCLVIPKGITKDVPHMTHNAELSRVAAED